jgi:D-beta-D-heptose 7-phosphate kinase/D-beta-D-heptose 1-phosphate adenosyltransferase
MSLPSSTPSNQKTVWLNGTFDVLHMGHINLFNHARKLAGPGGKVVVGTDSDERIRELKGPTRPINNIFDRIGFLRAIKYIDGVVTFSSEDELQARIKQFSPDILLIGDDYIGKPIVGAQYAKKIVYFPRYGGLSSSGIINR